jgi:hypothetical protein
MCAVWSQIGEALDQPRRDIVIEQQFHVANRTSWRSRSAA